MSPRTSGEFAFYGEWTIRFPEDLRIRLPIDVTRQLKKAAVKALRPFAVPNSRTIYLIPATDWDRQITELQADYTQLNTVDGHRALLAPARELWWRSQGRLSLPKRYWQDHAKLQPGDDIVVVGVRRRFELWPNDDYWEMVDRFREGPNPAPPGE